jgi:hypothetical protein
MRHRLALLSVLLFTACGGGLERVSFVSDLLSYRPGGRVALTMVNTSAQPLGINLCLSQLVGEDRQTAGPAGVEMCDLAAEPLEPGDQLEVRKVLPSGTPAGTWRYETTIRLPSGLGEKVFTPPFTVAP